MAAAKRTKASDKQGVCKKIVSILKKRYKVAAKPVDRPILETMIYAICLENASNEEADLAFERLLQLFHDLNEIRVSSILEIEPAFENMPAPEWRALRVRNLLNYVFEKHYSFDFEQLRKKTLELATKQLLKINDLTPFVRSYTLQHSLGSHLLPLDDRMFHSLQWLGLIELDSTMEQGTDGLKSAIRKAEAPQFCDLLRSLSCDPKLSRAFEFDPKALEEDAFDIDTATDRLTHLIEHGPPPARKVAKKPKAAAKAKVKTSKKVSKPAPAKTASVSKTKTKTATRKKASTKVAKPAAAKKRTRPKKKSK